MPDVTDDTEDLMDDLEKETSRPVSPATLSETVRSGSENEEVHNVAVKRSRLEQTLGKIKMQLDYSLTVTENIIKKLEKDLHGKNKKEAVKFIHDFFEDMISDDGFIRWLANGVGYQPARLKQLLKENKTNTRNTKFGQEDFQEIYDFWLQNCFNSNESFYNLAKITKRSFLEHYSNIRDTNLIEKQVKMKHSSKMIYTALRMVYIDSVRKLHDSFNKSRTTPVLLSTFFKYKPYYCVRPTDKEKQSCLCIKCLNPHLLLKSINFYKKSKSLPSHASLIGYINQISNGKTFPESTDTKLCKFYTYHTVRDTKLCKFYTYHTVRESYIRKAGKPVEYTRTARVDDCKPVMHIFNLIKDGSAKYLKHRTYVDNCANVLPLLKDSYIGKFIDLDFSQNLSLRPKYEVQSAHFSGKQYTLHCAIVEPFDTRYHYHLSDDTKHDPFYVDQVLRDIIVKYDIKDEHLWIQSDNAPIQYRNKHGFALLQELADDFNLRIIRTYSAAGHGKGVIDAMSSFGAKNILRKDIVIHDVFFINSAEIVHYRSLSFHKPSLLLHNSSG